MLDKKTFTTLYKDYAELVRRVCERRGVNDSDVDEVSQEVWTDLWRRRASWPNPAPENPGAYLAECAHRKAKMHFRSASALKRAAFHEPLQEDRTSTADIQLSRAPDALKLVEQTSIGTLLRRLADRVGGKRKQVMLDQLNHDKQTVLAEEPSAVQRGFYKMIYACRKHLGLPSADPGSAGVDPLTHLAGVVRRFKQVDAAALAGFDTDPNPSDAE